MALPGGPMEICFSFDTTGSVNSCINEVKGKVQDMIKRLQVDIPGIRMAVLAHGDYCDYKKYVTKHIDFTTSVADLCSFIKTVDGTFGGDGDECYELVLQEVQSLSWTPESKRALVVIGDSDPHEPGYSFGGKTYNIHWRKETYNLLTMNVRIYGVQCGGYASSTDFYNKISSATDGKCLKLENFANMFDFMMAICYREHDETLLHNYEAEVRARGTNIHKDLEELFGKLKRDDTMEIMDTSPSPPVALAKIPSLTKPPSFKVLKPVCKMSSRTARKPRTSHFRSKHERLMDKRNEERLSKYKLKNLPKLKREKVPETNFMLNDAPWSKWEIAITSRIPEGELPTDYTPRKGIYSGYKKNNICGGVYDKPALYEFAVQTLENGKKYVVYCKCNKGFSESKASWESKLLSKPEVKKEVEGILSKGGRLFVRRYLLTKSKTSSDKLGDLRHYDYAWRGQRNERTSPRSVQIRY